VALVTFNTLYDQVLPYLPGIETPIVDSQIRKVLREFMQRTTLCRETFAFSTSAANATYLLTPSYGQVSSLLEVRYNDRRIPVAPEDRRDAGISAGEPVAWYSPVPNLITIYPAPDTEYTIEVDAVLTLQQNDVLFPDELFNHYAESLAAGVLAITMSMPGKPWSQRQAAAEYGRVYAGKIREIRGRLRDGGQPNASTFIAARKFGA
jgi:hypothetical protein